MLEHKIQKLKKQTEKCYEHCSDYACARAGQCTGGASFELKQLREKLREQMFKLICVSCDRSFLSNEDDDDDLCPLCDDDEQFFASHHGASG